MHFYTSLHKLKRISQMYAQLLLHWNNKINCIRNLTNLLLQPWQTSTQHENQLAGSKLRVLKCEKHLQMLSSHTKIWTDFVYICAKRERSRKQQTGNVNARKQNEIVITQCRASSWGLGQCWLNGFDCWWWNVKYSPASITLHLSFQHIYPPTNGDVRKRTRTCTITSKVAQGWLTHSRLGYTKITNQHGTVWSPSSQHFCWANW